MAKVTEAGRLRTLDEQLGAFADAGTGRRPDLNRVWGRSTRSVGRPPRLLESMSSPKRSAGCRTTPPRGSTTPSGWCSGTTHCMLCWSMCRSNPPHTGGAMGRTSCPVLPPNSVPRPWLPGRGPERNWPSEALNSWSQSIRWNRELPTGPGWTSSEPSWPRCWPWTRSSTPRTARRSGQPGVGGGERTGATIRRGDRRARRIRRGRHLDSSPRRRGGHPAPHPRPLPGGRPPLPGREQQLPGAVRISAADHLAIRFRAGHAA